MKPLVTLRTGECKWPVERHEGRHLFCAEPVKPGKSYCACHCKIAYVAPRQYTDLEISNMLKRFTGSRTIRSRNKDEIQDLTEIFGE
jgi:hypothetical protein